MTAPVPAAPESPQETPAEVLRRAAAKVRELAVQATPGPWRVARDAEMCTGQQPSVTNDVGDWPAECGPERGIDSPNGRGPEDARWIALMSPVVATPLAAVLDDAAERAARLDALLAGPFADLAEARARGLLREPDVDLPLALAKALMGEAS